MQAKKIYWQTFNVLVRIIAVGFVIAGAMMVLQGFSLVNPKATLDFNGVPTHDPWIKALPLAVGLIMASLGILLLKARRYRPDLGDEAFARKKKPVVMKDKFP